MKLLLRGLLICLLLLVACVVMILGGVIDTIFRIIRSIRYVYLRIISSILGKMNLNIYESSVYNRFIIDLSVDDTYRARKIEDLRV